MWPFWLELLSAPAQYFHIVGKNRWTNTVSTKWNPNGRKCRKEDLKGALRLITRPISQKHRNKEYPGFFLNCRGIFSKWMKFRFALLQLHEIVRVKIRSWWGFGPASVFAGFCKILSQFSPGISFLAKSGSLWQVLFWSKKSKKVKAKVWSVFRLFKVQWVNFQYWLRPSTGQMPRLFFLHTFQAADRQVPFFFFPHKWEINLSLLCLRTGILVHLFKIWLKTIDEGIGDQALKSWPPMPNINQT